MIKRRWRCKAGQQPTELDKRIMYLENKGALVPTPDLIKTPEQIQGIRDSAKITTARKPRAPKEKAEAAPETDTPAE